MNKKYLLMLLSVMSIACGDSSEVEEIDYYTSTLLRHAQSDDITDRHNLALSNDQLPKQVVDILMADHEEFVVSAILSNPSTSLSVINERRLGVVNRLNVNSITRNLNFKNINDYPELLEMMINIKPDIFMCVEHNDIISDELFAEILGDKIENWRVVRTALENEERLDEEFQRNYPELYEQLHIRNQSGRR